MHDDIQQTVIIPLAAALITGAFCLLLVLTLGAWFDWPAAWAGIAGAGAAFLTWCGWSARMAHVLEYRLAPDLPKTQAAPGQAAPRTINLHIHSEDENGYPEGAFLDRLPISDSRLAELATLAISGRSLTTSQITAGGVLDRPTWEVLRDRFISAGLLAWRSGSRTHGCEVTGRGLVVFRRLAAARRPTPYHKEIGE
jgi:hypothetical protein